MKSTVSLMVALRARGVDTPRSAAKSATLLDDLRF